MPFDVACVLCRQMIKTILSSYTDDPASSKDWARVLNDGHLQRLRGYVEDAVAKVLPCVPTVMYNVVCTDAVTPRQGHTLCAARTTAAECTPYLPAKIPLQPRVRSASLLRPESLRTCGQLD